MFSNLAFSIGYGPLANAGIKWTGKVVKPRVLCGVSWEVSLEVEGCCFAVLCSCN